MVARVKTVAFQGIDVLDIDVQVQISSGLPSFQIVGLPDKAVADLEQADSVQSKHIAEAANYRHQRPGQSLAA